ncbi:MAG: hypothetical protein IJW24_04345 [Clostridia bacterium]|nr:hypothetical protein [Clostridia bacterium]
MNKTIKLGHIELTQSTLIEKRLKPQHVIILDYLYQFFESGNAVSRTKGSKKEKYYLITMNKILTDLPFLRIKKRRLQELISDLETAQIIKRYTLSKNCPTIFIKLDLSSIIAY